MECFPCCPDFVAPQGVQNRSREYVQDEVEEVDRHRHLIRHQADVPVLVSAMKANPDWFLTTNIRHFTKQVALRTQLKILTPQEFLTSIRVLS
jgi:predicted nucleic acid-binding protein